MMPTTVKMLMVGTIVSVIAGGPSKNTSSGARLAEALVATGALAVAPFLFPRFA